MRCFTTEPLSEAAAWLTGRLEGTEPGAVVAFEVLDPDLGEGRYAGELVEVGGKSYRHRGYRAWTDLSELLFCRMLTPKPASEQTVVLRFEKLDRSDSFHAAAEMEKTEKYGTASRFSAIDKLEEPAFLAAYGRALESVKIASRRRVLDLGVNTGDEFELIRRMLPAHVYGGMELVGVDHSASAAACARERFPEGNATFHVHDVNDLDALALGRFDLIVSVGTLQSPGVDFKPLFMALVQRYLEQGGAVILGFPNCRWMGGEMLYGAKAPNYAYSEQSLLYKDVYFCKKYLQQKKFRVTLTGKPYLFLTATPIRR
jgi:SAM-dependent methyltransferase